ncbi:protein kinase [Ornithinimicrobium faecis]|uniref:non-specific serine/threonine protein kinase n=1 Tax=Ornithinimicrobium faecis TaxID=2934158 RepID=A0ABY4YRI8_9MICO|nr:protein kinase [Ornithinimicrobium sp. HY1793]USQ78905.1 protein kinase [Ornithinimicrobium sp. HY1793]
MEEPSLHGEQLGPYRLEDVVGVGSFATVYRAVDDRLHDTVVVKVLAENHSLNAEVRERFIAEGRSLRRVGGAHAVTLHDIGETNRQQPYLVLEHADRGTLQQRVTALWREGWRASREDVLALARPLAAAVDSVHRAHLVHRDLSPGNLLLTSTATTLAAHRPDGTGPPTRTRAGETATRAVSRLLGDDERLLVADLGMCKDLALNSGLTVAAGTSGFRPPEQSGPGVVDIRADLWALSALLVWITQETDLPAAFQRVLKRGMSTSPERRQPDAASWLADVEQALAGPEPRPEVSRAQSVPEPVPPAPTPARSRPRRGALMGAVVVGALLVGALTGYLLRTPEDPVSQAAGVTISVLGPEEVVVGEPASFTAQVEGVQSWTWLLPTGRYVSDESQVALTPTATGGAELILRARAPDGTELEERHRLRVVE